jgi:hypothetical protein
MAFLVATPLSDSQRNAIRMGEIWHFSKATAQQITMGALPGGPGQPNAIVNLSPPTGWQWDFWKFVRDAAVWDPNVFDAADRGCYLYCFLGEPGFMARVTNVQDAPLVVRIRGADLLARVPASNLLARTEFSTVVVVRGGYVGPALLDPPPLNRASRVQTAQGLELTT